MGRLKTILRNFNYFPNGFLVKLVWKKSINNSFDSGTAVSIGYIKRKLNKKAVRKL